MRNDRQENKKIRVRSFITAFSLLLACNTAEAVVPTAPSNLIATGIPPSHIALSWTDNSNNETSFKIERKTGSGGTYSQISTAGSNVVTFEDSGLTAGTTYFYRVRASNSSGNSAYSNVASVTLSGDTISPTQVTGLTATAVSSNQVNLSWTASTDNVGVAGYRISRCQANGGCFSYTQIATVTTTSYSDTGLTSTNGTNLSYIVFAFDAAGNTSPPMFVGTTLSSDTTAPSAPSGLTVTGVSATQINLSWTASTDNVAVAGYRLERCQGVGCGSLDSDFSLIAAPTGTTFSDTGLWVATTYKYRVRAADAAGNVSAYSNIATATTQAPDTTAPTVPTGLSAVAAGTTQVNLAWTASTDNVGVTGYLVERCQGAGCTTFAQIAAPAATILSDTGLTAGTGYSYRVRATDAAGNLSDYSNIASATTASTQAQGYYIVPDHLGTPRFVSNQGGTIVWRWSQAEPFGSATPETDPDGDGIAFDFPLRFPGQYADQDTGANYNYYRDYASGLGRYVEADPAGLRGGINVYGYVGARPISNRDPRGLDNPGMGPYGPYWSWPPFAVEPGIQGVCPECIFIPSIRVPWMISKLCEPNDGIPASTPTGQRGSPMDVEPGTNTPSTIGGRDYTGHALDQMQGRGVTPSVVEDTIATGARSPGNTSGTIVFENASNGVSVVTDSNGRVITVITTARH